MRYTMRRPLIRGIQTGASFAAVEMLGGCLQTVPVVVTPQDQAARLMFNCPQGRTHDVTRVQGNTSALLVVDGKTIQLPRDSATTSAERYTNRIQTLTLIGTSASFDALGQATTGPCTISGMPLGAPGGLPAGQRDGPNYSD